MFLQPPFSATMNLQNIALIMNTVLLIACILIAEFRFAEVPAAKRQYLRYIYPLLLVLVGLLIFAAYHQVGRTHG